MTLTRSVMNGPVNMFTTLWEEVMLALGWPQCHGEGPLALQQLPLSGFGVG